VSGGTSGAEAGTITFMMGAGKNDVLFESIKPILQTMGTNIIPCGGPTLGLATKLCNNYISGTIAIATAEGMNMAVRLGLDPKVFSEAVSVSTGGSWVNCMLCAERADHSALQCKMLIIRTDTSLCLEL
jgi:3-hydroxyisobutyrate dehydrogenase-like beta-hydroxyacid dehydrogenase